MSTRRGPWVWRASDCRALGEVSVKAGGKVEIVMGDAIVVGELASVDAFELARTVLGESADWRIASRSDVSQLAEIVERMELEGEA